MLRRLTKWISALLLTLCVVSCVSLMPRVNFVPPTIPPPAVFLSAEADKNDKTGELGVWLNEKDAKLLLKERVILRSIIEQYRAYFEKTQK